MPDATNNLVPTIVDLAAQHGLDIDVRSISVNELGLDFRVAITRTTDGQQWVLRIPRRADVMERGDVEGRLLKVVAPHLNVAVPHWRIHTRKLVAYPLLPGEPGLEITETGEPVWKVDVSSDAYSLSMGDLLGELHAVDTDAAAAAGIESHSPHEVRAKWRADIDRVAAEFAVADHLMARWDAWLADDSYWPDFSVVTHGEIYPAHTLVVDSKITAVLDWTTAAIGDPARDFTFHKIAATPEAFDLTIQRYEQRGGKTWPRLAEHAAEMFSASPVNYGIYVMETGDEQHREPAMAALNPPVPTD